ncbi:Uncharacterized protein TCM_023698 [Theobroma cacao]|uniref:Uncharacterized protein n=1 Tax=Theobroma cacao TaxID=3641 RepID=A0A061EUF8_THECC|nr:Uncharacterized protein TCM_023698 [Theobroma cacao]
MRFSPLFLNPSLLYSSAFLVTHRCGTIPHPGGKCRIADTFLGRISPLAIAFLIHSLCHFSYCFKRKFLTVFGVSELSLLSRLLLISKLFFITKPFC